MAWKTRDGRTSDAEQGATRRGTEPHKGIHDRAAARADVQARMDRVKRTHDAIERGDWGAVFWPPEDN